ncbi:MAG: aminopeptidase [Proteobacteria bacterium]|nr:MAG: aminopeptidase [Pseudomonadota bacterium]
MAISRARNWAISIVLALVVSAAAGCSTVGYYLQAVNGQMEISRKAHSIDKLLADPATDPQLRAKLQRVAQIRDYASRELALPDNGSYRRYADLKRPFVVWNVFAAPEFSLRPHEWCFPFAGCVGYKGYFSKEGAERLAADLREEHYDVFVGGVPAYSTLGWFDDPVLNTVIRYPDAEIARLIFHELAHQVVYVKGDSTFNESFAVTVEEEGVRRWLASFGTPAERDEYQRADRGRAGFAELVERYRKRLESLYARPTAPDAMRREKQQVFDDMRTDYRREKTEWGFSGYDRWFEQPLNNAQLASVAIYSQLVPGFQHMLAAVNDDLPRFFAAVKELAKLPEAQRRAKLES